jgi:hypothetical protein
MIFLKIKAFSLLILLLISVNSYALIHNDSFATRILKVNEENILVLDRGVEDGVERGDHIKITNRNGFMARAIALRAGMVTSHWKIYRVIYPEKISKDLTYKAVSITNNTIAENYIDFRDEDNASEYTDFNETELLAWARKEDDDSVTTDLPKNMLGDPVLELEPDFGQRNFDGEQFAQDFKKWSATVSIPAFSYASTRKESKVRTLNSNVVITNVGTKYNLSYTYGRNDTKTESFSPDENDFDPSDGIDIVENHDRQRTDSHSLTFSIYNIIPRIAATANFDRQIMYSNAFKTSETTTIAPLGMTITMIKPDSPDGDSPWTLSLNPGYTKTISYFELGQVDWDTGETLYVEENRTFSLSLVSEINFSVGNLTVANSTTWAPQIDPKDYKSFNTGDVTIDNDFSLQFPISTRLSGAVTHNYQYSYIPQFGPLQDQKHTSTVALTLMYSINW